MKSLKELEQKNARLKKMYPEGINTPKRSSKRRLSARRSNKSGEAISTQRDGTTSSDRERRVDPFSLPQIRHFGDLLSLSGEAQR